MSTIEELLEYREKIIARDNERLEQLKQKYDKVSNVHSWYLVKKDGVNGVVQYEGDDSREIMFEGVELISRIGTYPELKNNLFCVRKNGMWGYVDDKGQEIIPCIYDQDSVPDDIVRCVLDIFDSEYVDDFCKNNLNLIVEEESFYQVLMYSLHNRFDLARESKDQEVMNNFVNDLRPRLAAVMSVILQSGTESSIANDGLAVLQKFYNENISSLADDQEFF